MISLAILLNILILFSILYIIIVINNMRKDYEQNELIKQQNEIKKQELIKQKNEIKRQELIKQQNEIKKQKENEAKKIEEDTYNYDGDYDNILLLTILECFNNKLEPINNIIKRIINKFKHCDKLDKDTTYDFNDIFNGATIDKEIDLIKLVFSLDNIKNKQYLKDNIFIDREETVNELLEYAIKNNMYELCEFVLESKSCKIDDDTYIELEKLINNNNMSVLLLKYKIEDVYHNILL